MSDAREVIAAFKPDSASFADRLLAALADAGYVVVQNRAAARGEAHDAFQRKVDDAALAAPFVTKSGRVLTDADIEALSDEADRGYTVPSLHEIVAQAFKDAREFTAGDGERAWRALTDEESADLALSAIREALSEGALRDARVEALARSFIGDLYSDSPRHKEDFQYARRALDAADALLWSEG